MARPFTFALRRPCSATGLATLLVLGACASSVPPPIAEMASARTALSTAESAGALQAAPTEFLSARDKLMRADTASKDKKFLEARRYAEEAAVDAQLAERKARAARATSAAQDLQRSNGVLSNELSDKPS